MLQISEDVDPFDVEEDLDFDLEFDADDVEPISVGRCDTHFLNLALGLALTFVERRENNKVINYWAQFRELYNVLKDAFKYLYDKKNKQFGHYKKVLNGSNHPVIRSSLPAKTRVAGAFLVHQDSLRSMHAWRFYANRCDKFERLCPIRAQWRNVAQYESVMRVGGNMCFQSQQDRVETSGEMVLAVVLLKANYVDQKVYDVVDVDQEWKATTPFSELPRVQMTIDSELAQTRDMA